MLTSSNSSTSSIRANDNLPKIDLNDDLEIRTNACTLSTSTLLNQY